MWVDMGKVNELLGVSLKNCVTLEKGLAFVGLGKKTFSLFLVKFDDMMLYSSQPNHINSEGLRESADAVIYLKISNTRTQGRTLE